MKKLIFYSKSNNLILKLKSLIIIATIHKDKLRKLQERYHDAPSSPEYGKYLAVRYYMFINLKNLVMLGLDRSKKKNILDIGTGCGYFPFACQHYGHRCMTIDLGVNPLFNDFRKLFGVPCTLWQVRAYEPLPDMGMKFDIITAFLVRFNINNLTDNWGEAPDELSNYWGVSEWEFFINDLKENQLNENGKIFILLNKEYHSEGRNYSEELHQFFLSAGASVNGGTIIF